MLVSEGEKIHCFKPLNHRCLFLLYTINIRIVRGLLFLVGMETSAFHKKQYIFLKYYYDGIFNRTVTALSFGLLSSTLTSLQFVARATK